MPEKILLRCLFKNSNPYYVVKKLKSAGGELDFDKLKIELGMEKEILIQAITNLYPSVTQNGSKVSISKNYDFLIAGNFGITNHYRAKCAKHNRSRRTSKEVPIGARDLGAI